NGYVLHPSVMDAALQGMIGLSMASSEEAEADKPALPFAVEQVDVYAGCGTQGWAWVRHSAGGGAEDRVRKMHVVVCVEQGQVWVSLKGLASRVLDGAVEEAGEAKTTETEETKTPSETERPVVAAVRIDSGELREKVQWALTQGVSQLLKVKSQDIDADVEFSEYG